MQPWAEIFRLTGSQAEAVSARGQDVIVKAGAGSGKTSTLVARYLSLLDGGCLPRGVVAITFTEKAAREMRNRIRQAIHQLLAGPGLTDDRARWQAIEADIDAARIGTIHGLCAALLRAHPAEAGVDPQFDVLEEGRAATLRAQAVEMALAWGIEQPGLQALFAAISADELSRSLAKLLEGRLDASGLFDVPDWPERWRTAVAEALRRFAARADVQSALAELRALTGSKASLLNDAGDKLVEPIQTLLANWAAFEAAADPLAAALALYTTRHAYRPGGAGKKTSRAKAAAKAWCEAFDAQLQDWLGGKDKGDPAPDAALERQAAETVGGLRPLFEKARGLYQAGKAAWHSLDFDDLEAGALQLLERGDIRARWQRQIDALLVDEFQDTNERQRRIVEALAGRPEGRVGRLFVVGDEKQSIYRFRGADVTVFRRLDRNIRARGGLPLALTRTFRAHQALVETLNELLGAVMGVADDAEAEGFGRRPFAVPFAELQADRVEPGRGVAAPYLEVLLGLGENADEARGVAAQLLARRLRQLHDTTQLQWEHMALLFRASTGFPDYEAALEGEGIPFVTVAGRGFYARPEIRDLLNGLHALADPSDDLALAGLLRSPAFGLSDVALYQLRWPPGAVDAQGYRAALAGDLGHLSEIDRQQAEQARDRLAHLTGLVDRVSVAELLKALLELTLYPAVLASTEAGARLQRNVEKLLADAHTSRLVRVSEFLDYLETLQAVGAREGEAPTEAGGAVRLMTVHKAKGLQFPLVVLADAARSRPNVSEPTLLSSAYGVVPGQGRGGQAPLIFRLAKQAEADQAEAEDLRLLYVAATRVEEKLIVCGHHSNRAAESWLAQLMGAAGLDPADMAAKPDTWHTLTLPGCQQTVSGWAATSVPQAEPAAVPAPLPGAADTPAAPLYHSLLLPVEDEVTERPKKHVLRARRVTGRYRQLDGALVGELVHAAIRWWRFPGHPSLESLLQTTLLERGVVEPVEAEVHLRRAMELLARLKTDARWLELEAADRHHEVPYSLVQGERAVNGFIDLLYCGPDDRWRIIDFKTDAIADEADLERLLAEGYRRQLLRYQAAVLTLLGQPTQISLCLLDYAGGVRWEAVDL
jgi:ATP-dependent helicase/nuclease subunit A